MSPPLIAILERHVPTAATSTIVPPQTRTRALLADYVILTKPRVSLMVIITAAAGYYLGCLRSSISPFNIALVKALVGIALVTAGSSALNQALERHLDRLMPRTAQRPMAQHRIGLAHGLVFGFLLVFGGSLFLALQTNLITGSLTPAHGGLLRRHLHSTQALHNASTPSSELFPERFLHSSAGPPRAASSSGRPSRCSPSCSSGSSLTSWPSAGSTRADYANAGIRVTATQQPIAEAARASVIQAIFYAVLMIPVSLWTTWLHVTGIPYAIAATLLGAWYLHASIDFAKITRNPESEDNRKIARTLLKVSVMYLPLLLLAMMLNAQGRLLF